MAISIDWGTKIIFIPKADTQLVQAVPTEIRQLDLDAFRLTLKDLEDDDEGIPFPDTHEHVSPFTVGGATLARAVKIINGYTVTFEDGQYAVNLSGANSNVGDVTNVNQVSIRSANSAGLTFSEEINDQSYLGKIWIDVDFGNPGTAFSRGTPTNTVNNWPDAAVINATRKFNNFNVTGTLFLPVLEDVSRFTFDSLSPLRGQAICQGNPVASCVFERLAMGGVVSGQASYRECQFLDGFTGMEGVAVTCGLSGVLNCNPTATEGVVLKDCFSAIAGNDRPEIRLNSSVQNVQVRGYFGGLTLTGFDQGQGASFDFDAGILELDATCTAGVVVVRGNCQLIDNSGSGCVVVDDRPNKILLDSVLP